METAQTENTGSKGNDIEYDLVIVGGGPSAIGLIYGLLLPYTNERTASTASTSTTSQRRIKVPPFTIAVIERGESFDTPSSTNIQDPQMWFRAAHPYSASYRSSRSKVPSSTSSVEYQTVPQKGLGNRVLHVPTGQGMGGGTNINACLVVRPSLDDFKHWPKYWTEPVPVPIPVQVRLPVTVNAPAPAPVPKIDMDETMPRIMAAVVQVENEMRRNGALVQESCDENGTQIMTSDGRCKHWVENKFEFEKCSLDHDNECLSGKKLCTVTNAVRAVKKCDDDGYTGRSRRGYECRHLYRRVNYFEGILKPFLDRNPHLKKVVMFMTGVLAERLLFDQDDAVPRLSIKGIQCSRVGDEDGAIFSIRAKHVVLSAGAILTPLLLLASGIGEEGELRKEGIEPRLVGKDNHWGGVGKRLCDQVVTACAFLTLKPVASKNRVNSARGWIGADIQGCSNDGKGPTCSSRVLYKLIDGSSSSAILPSIVAGVFQRTYNFEPRWVCHIVNSLLEMIAHVVSTLLRLLLNMFPLRYLLATYTVQYLVCLMNPSSKGCVKIRRRRLCKNYGAVLEVGMSHYYPEIDPQYLSDESDCKRLTMGWQIFRRFSHQWSMGKVEILPGVLYKMCFGSTTLLNRYLSDFAIPYYHWSGSCAMKCDLVGEIDYVVNEQLQVRNIRNLYVCDASVHPDILSVPPALTLAAMGLASAEIVERVLRRKHE